MNRPQPSPPPPRPARPAAHVQAALARSAQPRMPDRAAQTARRPPIAPPPVVFRSAGPAPHVAAVQARMATPASPPVRTVAPHVQAALGRGVQAKLAPAPTPRAAVPPAPSARAVPRTAPAPTPRVVQRMQQPIVQDDGVTRGQVRDGDTVKTAGGTWTAARYVAITRYNYAPCHGAFMKLEFTPEDPADATKIALVQSVTVAKNERMYYGNQTIKNRSVVGTSIDQDESSRSPLYVENPGTGGGGLGSSSVQQGAGEHGYRYHDGEGWKVKKAWLKDMPHLRDVDEFSFQVFETTALAVEGNDAGTYYGSVKWGWWESNGGVLLVPLRVLSHGSVTDEFKASLKKWNQTQTSTGATPQQLPDAS